MTLAPWTRALQAAKLLDDIFPGFYLELQINLSSDYIPRKQFVVKDAHQMYNVIDADVKTPLFVVHIVDKVYDDNDSFSIPRLKKSRRF